MNFLVAYPYFHLPLTLPILNTNPITHIKINTNMNTTLLATPQKANPQFQYHY